MCLHKPYVLVANMLLAYKSLGYQSTVTVNEQVSVARKGLTKYLGYKGPGYRDTSVSAKYVISFGNKIISLPAGTNASEERARLCEAAA